MSTDKLVFPVYTAETEQYRNVLIAELIPLVEELRATAAGVDREFELLSEKQKSLMHQGARRIEQDAVKDEKKKLRAEQSNLLSKSQGINRVIFYKALVKGDASLYPGSIKIWVANLTSTPEFVEPLQVWLDKLTDSRLSLTKLNHGEAKRKPLEGYTELFTVNADQGFSDELVGDITILAESCLFLSLVLGFVLSNGRRVLVTGKNEHLRAWVADSSDDSEPDVTYSLAEAVQLAFAK